ncbi:MAG: DUF86 domain-containing protein [Peptococcaceae bacterium]|nr:DUF86 domain-containing protein [Candidatus Syntrophopropionicum ammoniitolerans]
MVDRDVLQRKILFIEKTLWKLKKTAALSHQEFMASFYFADAAKYNLQAAIEAMIDIASHIVARKRWGIPTTSGEYIKLLTEHGVFYSEQGLRFQRMVRFRNRIVHLYQEVDEEQLYQILQQDLGDFSAFIQAITRAYLAGPGKKSPAE